LYLLKYTVINDWPPLAWAARCIAGSNTIAVYHGAKVEAHEEWFCEAVWDGEYREGNFDQTDIIFGSGGRLREGTVTFVSSGTTVDRLHYWLFKGGVWISNSLPCLLAVTGGTLDLTEHHYYWHLGSIVHGLDRYKRHLDVSNGVVTMVDFQNLRWAYDTLTEIEKPRAQAAAFASFEGYHEFLKTSLAAISRNMSSCARKLQYEFLGTLSSGYDSATATVLAHQVGLRAALTFCEARGGNDDDGRAIADLLGVTLIRVPRNGWKQHAFPEVPFLAADAMGEDVYYKPIESRGAGKVVLTGYQGDKVWGKDAHHVGSTVIRADRSGLSLTEYRLWVGFIHLPVPFMGVRQAQEINTISNSSDMKPWDVPGDYSRPICRRIVEGAGVARNQFGLSKKGAAVLFGRDGDKLTTSTRDALYAWLRLHQKEWDVKGKASPITAIKVFEAITPLYEASVVLIKRLARRLPRPAKSAALQGASRLERLKFKNSLIRHSFPWAIEQTKMRYHAYHELDGE
jgi:hypothetical protein